MHHPPPLHPTDPPRWWQRNWRWAVPLLLLACVLVLLMVVWAVLAQWSRWSRSSEPYQEAMRRARCSIELVAVLGEPIQDGYLPSGSFQREADGSAYSEWVVELSGPRGSGQMYLEAHREQGRWDYPTLYVLTDATEAVDLTVLDDVEAAGACPLRECREQDHCITPGGRGMEPTGEA